MSSTANLEKSTTNLKSNKKPLEPGWDKVLGDEFNKPYFDKLRDFLRAEKNSQKTVYPPSNEIFNAFNLTPFSELKVVILGQDPYHGPNQAHGLAFSVKKGIAIPPSLRNIYKELTNDLDFVAPEHGNLTTWAKQGVLLLNTVLTVRAHDANSHRKQGWETFTDQVILTISEKKSKIIFVLWGSPAKTKLNLIDTDKHYVLTSPHPSPLSASKGFLGCKHFSTINQLLLENNQTPINWQLPVN